MDLPQTPLPHRSGNFRVISKKSFNQLIESLDFDSVFVPEAIFSSDSESDTPAAMAELAQVLSDVMVNSPPKSASPKRLLQSTLSIHSLGESPSPLNTPTPQFTRPVFRDPFLQTPNTSFAGTSQISTLRDIYTTSRDENTVLPFSSNSSLYIIDPSFAGTSQVSIPSDIDTTTGDQNTLAVATDSQSPSDDHSRPQHMRSSSASTLVPDNISVGIVPGTLPHSFIGTELNIKVRRSRFPFASSITEVDASEVPRPSPELRKVIYSKLDQILKGPDPYVFYLNVATIPPSSLQYIQISGYFSPIEGTAPSRHNGNPSPSLSRNFKFVKSAIYDSGADSCVVCDDYLGLSLQDDKTTSR